jgi:DNA polymerase elongation subunit (family B)
MSKKNKKWTAKEDNFIRSRYIDARPLDRYGMTDLTEALNKWYGNDRSQDAVRNRAHILRREKQQQGTVARRQQWFEGARFGFYDIETVSGFAANYGAMCSWAIYIAPVEVLENGKVEASMNGYIKWDAWKRSEAINPKKFDKRIVKSLVKCIWDEVDVLVGYYSSRFDDRYIRTRAGYWGIPFPQYQEKYAYDVWKNIRATHKLGRNTLAQATALYGIEGKNHVIADVWNAARVGDPEAMEYVIEHNVEDVKILAELFNKTNGARPLSRTSL